MKKLFASSCLLILAACGRPIPEQTSAQHLDINVPTDEIDPEDIQDLTGTLEPFVVEGKSVVSFQDIAARLNVTGDFKPLFDQLVASRDDQIEVECQGRKCVAKSSGKDFSFKPPVTLPVIGAPTISLAKEITIFAELSSDKSRLEVCRIDGVRVKVGIFTQNVDGALIETVGEGPDLTVKTLKLDAGVGGSYPSASCQS